MMYKILKLDEDKWTKFEFIHYYPGKFSLFLIFYYTIWGCYCKHFILDILQQSLIC